ncbi:MAG TPA: cadherin-like beta sandwich domain-containing protein [Spirochaetota bacterium]|nr:cadherin-like beta sandwich domain-containing protein [Spirochaetota bacterium]
MKRVVQQLLRIFYGAVICLLIVGCDNTAGDKMDYDDGISSNARLSNLILSDGEFEYGFNPYDWVQNASVPYEVDSITLSPQAQHAMAVISINGATVDSGSASEEIDLVVGENVIMVMVTAWDGTEFIYAITVYRLENSNGDLASLGIYDNNNTPDNTSDDVAVSLKETFSANTLEYSAVVGESVDYIGMTVTAEEGTVAVLKAGSGIGDLGHISVDQGLNRFLITVTAPDGTTKKYYTLSVTKLVGDTTNGKVTGFVIQSVTLNPEYDYEDLESPDWSAFTFNTATTIAIGKIENNLAKLVVTTESTAAVATITIDGQSTTVTGVATAGSLEFPLQTSYASGDFDGFEVDQDYEMVVTVRSQNSAHNATFTVDIEVSAGSSDATLSSLELFWGSHNSQRVLYPGNFDRSGIYHDPTVYVRSTFDSTKTGYVALVYSSDSARIELATNDAGATVTFNGGAGTYDSGKYVYYVALTRGGVTPVEIVVVPANGKPEDTVTYTLYIKQLNVYEFYWGVYAPLNTKAFTRWEDIFGDQGVKTVNIPGIISGNLEWKVSLSGLQPRNTMTWTQYMDGNMDSGGYSMRVNYNDNHPTNNNLHGFMLNGSVSGLLDGISSKNGTITGAFVLYSPWGDTIGTVNAHYTVRSGKKIEGSDSYADFEYMGETTRMMYRDDNDGNGVNAPYPFTSTYVWEDSWDDVNW